MVTCPSTCLYCSSSHSLDWKRRRDIEKKRKYGGEEDAELEHQEEERVAPFGRSSQVLGQPCYQVIVVYCKSNYGSKTWILTKLQFLGIFGGNHENCILISFIYTYIGVFLCTNSGSWHVYAQSNRRYISEEGCNISWLPMAFSLVPQLKWSICTAHWTLAQS